MKRKIQFDQAHLYASTKITVCEIFPELEDYFYLKNNDWRFHNATVIASAEQLDELTNHFDLEVTQTYIQINEGW